MNEFLMLSATKNLIALKSVMRSIAVKMAAGTKVALRPRVGMKKIIRYAMPIHSPTVTKVTIDRTNKIKMYLL